MAEQPLSISELARRSGVPSKTLRYWERRGVLPSAGRTPTGYRVFPAESLRYIAFIRRSKEIGLNLAEMRQVLQLSRKGHCPCPDVVRWSDARTRSVAAEIRRLRGLLRRLRELKRSCTVGSCREACSDSCYLTEDLPDVRSARKRGENALMVSTQHERRPPCAVSGSVSARSL